MVIFGSIDIISNFVFEITFRLSSLTFSELEFQKLFHKMGEGGNGENCT